MNELQVLCKTVNALAFCTTSNKKKVSIREQLMRLLEVIKVQDFRSLVQFQRSNERLKKQHYVVCTIEQMLAIIRSKGYALCDWYNGIYFYNGSYWQSINERLLKQFLGQAAERMGIDPYQARFFAFQELLYKQFQAVALPPQKKAYDHTTRINLQNGTFTIGPKGSQLSPFDSSDFLRYQLPFSYKVTAQAPRFRAYLDQVLPDKGVQHILAEYIAYVFMPHLKLEKTVLLYGSGANGKSVFFEIVQALLGKENISSYSLQNLTAESGYYRAQLADVLLNYSTELNGRLSSSVFKQLVSGEPVEARLPYGSPFILSQYARLMFNCNELPPVVEHSPAFFRRFLIIPFEVTIPEAEQDKGLARKIIQEELSGVFNWVLEGVARLQRQARFSESVIVKKQLQQYEYRSDSVQLFLKENHYISSSTKWMKLQQLYEQYVQFCKATHKKVLIKLHFHKRLNRIGVKVQKKNIGLVAYITPSTQQLEVL